MIKSNGRMMTRSLLAMGNDTIIIIIEFSQWPVLEPGQISTTIHAT